MKLLLPLVLLTAFCATAQADLPAVEATNAVRRELPWLLITEADLAITTPTPVRQTIGLVETFFSTPLAFPVSASEWADIVEPADDLGPLFVLSDNLLGKSVAVDPETIAWEPPEPVPPSARTAIKKLVAAISAGQPFLNRAVRSVSPEDRARFAEMFEWSSSSAPLREEISSRRVRGALEGMKPYLDGDMRTAGGLVLMAVDEALAELRDTLYYVPAPIRFESPVGDIVIGGNGPDIYLKRDLEDAVILVDFGGRNTYVGPVAFARPGETRIVIDLGTSVEIRSDEKTPGSAGASLFGIAVLAMPSDQGVKRMDTGPWSQGATIGGVAACLMSGRVQAKAGRFSQGAGVHGIGIFNASLAADSSYTSDGYGQGVGGMRGIGFFRHQGNGAKLFGGLTEPDPREDGGAVSLCQGVGFGRRAYAGGGIGICTLTGDNISALSSYFAQGAGYWHSAGVFRLRGNSATIQGRRYALGAGVHSAFGHFEAFGNANRLLNWGVGPAYGWDRGVGSAIVMGDGVEVQAEWGVGTSNVGGRSFGYYKGVGGRFKVPELGTGQFMRNEPAYSIQVVTGASHRIQGFGELGEVAGGRALRNTWGLASLSSATLSATLPLAPPVWPPVEHGRARAAQAIDLRTELIATQGATSRVSVAALSDVAGAFSLDRETPREALRRLLSLSAEDAPFLVDTLDPAAFEQNLPLMIAIVARGAALTKQLYAVKDHEKGLLCTGYLRFSRPSVSIPFLLSRANGKDPAWAAAALRGLGFAMNGDTGEEPGTRALLEAISRGLEKGGSDERALALLRRIRFPEAIALLATCASIGPGERIELLSAGPQDITDRLESPGAGKFMDILNRDTATSRDRIKKELATIEKAKPSVRKLLEKKSKSRELIVTKAAVIAAGQMGRGKDKDAEWVEKFLADPRGDIREAAAVALARMGDGGVAALNRASRSSSARIRALAAFAAGHATTSQTRGVLETALADSSPTVLMTALAVIKNLPEALHGARDDLKKKAARRLSETTSRDLKLQLKLLQ